MDLSTYIGFPLILVVVFTLFVASVKILREYERAVVFTLGRFQKVKGPGLVLLMPFIQEMVRVDLRIQVIEIPTQDVISRDNVSMKVDAVLYFNVVNPEHHSGAELPSSHEHVGSDDVAGGVGTA
jgi:regulator of protease activity HflC (stomatin/prohibitin superfamily)